MMIRFFGCLALCASFAAVSNASNDVIATPADKTPSFAEENKIQNSEATADLSDSTAIAQDASVQSPDKAPDLKESHTEENISAEAIPVKAEVYPAVINDEDKIKKLTKSVSELVAASHETNNLLINVLLDLANKPISAMESFLSQLNDKGYMFLKIGDTTELVTKDSFKKVEIQNCTLGQGPDISIDIARAIYAAQTGASN